MSSKEVSLPNTVASPPITIKKSTDWKKVTTLAFTLLFAAGALASYHYDLNSLYLITAASAAGVCLVASIVLHRCKSTSQPVIHEKGQKKEAAQATIVAIPSATTPSVVTEPKIIILPDQAAQDLDDSIKLDEIPDEYDENDPRIGLLNERILLKIEYNQDFSENIKRLNALFIHASKNPAKFKVLAQVILKQSNFMILFSSLILEKIECSSEIRKDLEVILRDHIVKMESACFLDNAIISKVKNKYYNVNYLVIYMSEVFGEVNFFDNEAPVPQILYKALGSAIQLLCKEASNNSLPIQIIFDQRECRLPPAMYGPILPYLNGQNLISFKIIQDAGVHNIHVTNFSDETSVQLLLDILDSNPYLVEIIAKFDGITEEHREYLEATLKANLEKINAPDSD